MNPAEIVIGEVQTARGPQAVPLFAEAVRQASQAAHLQCDGETLSLHDGGANSRRIGVCRGVAKSFDENVGCSFVAASKRTFQALPSRGTAIGTTMKR